MSESGEPAEPALSRRDATAILLLAAGSAWGAGNIAPIVPDLASAFDLSLASVGLISGTLFFIGTIAGEAGGPKLAERIRVIRSLRLSAVLVGAGCLVLAAAPGFWALASGRVLAGLGLGVIAAVGPVFARTVGGIKGVGLFGGAFQGGIALGLGAGSVLADAGIDWRVGFLVSAAAGLSALTVLPADRRIELELTGGGFLAAAVRSAAVWRLALLFVAMFAAPLTIGAWLVHFLSVQGGMQLAVAGLLGFLLFAASGLFRFGGARLNDAGIPDAVLAGVMPLLASAGIVAIAFDQSLAVALPAVILIAAGFALPYAVMILAAQRLWPREPTEPVAHRRRTATALRAPATSRAQRPTASGPRAPPASERESCSHLWGPSEPIVDVRHSDGSGNRAATIGGSRQGSLTGRSAASTIDSWLPTLNPSSVALPVPATA